MKEIKVLNVSVNDKCTYCGICHSELPTVFGENEHGKIYVKKRIVMNNLIKQIEEVKQYCIVDAIETKIETVINSEKELISNIKKMINEEINNIVLPTLTYGDVAFDYSNYKCPISFDTISSKTKFLTDGLAERAGLAELRLIYNNNIEAVGKGSLIDYKLNVIEKIINRNNRHYVFKEVEDKLNDIIESIQSMLKQGFSIDTNVGIFNKSNSDFSCYQKLNTFQNNLFFIQEPTDMELYVTVDYNQYSDKYRYVLKKEDIESVFRNVVYDNFDTYDSSVWDDANQYYKSYITAFVNHINDFKKDIYVKLYSIGGSLETSTNTLKQDYNLLVDKLLRMKQDWKEGYFVTFDTDWDSDYRFVFRGDAKKAAERRIARMEREYTRSFEKYAETLGQRYSENICNYVNEFLRELQNIAISSGVVMHNKSVCVNLDRNKNINININNSFLDEDVKQVIAEYVTEIAKETINSITNYNWFYFTIDDAEVYCGESIFGRSKFVKKYNYYIDDINEKMKECYKEQRKMDEILFNKSIPTFIYKKIVKEITKVLQL